MTKTIGENTIYIFIINIIITFILTLTLQEAKSQVFSSEQNPPSLKWMKIETKNFEIIYPSEFEEQAQRMANTLEHVVGKVSASLKKQPRKISIILQNQGTTSNGFVQLAPRRSEFFTTPSQAFDYQNWLNSLAVHELRHVVQFDKLTGWFNKPPFEALALAMFGVTLPSWFFEGDAVTTETVLTNGGRGRIPEWYINMRTNTLSGKRYSYSKDYFGSVKDFTPGYYQLGFFMNTKLRRDFGNTANDSLLSRIKLFPLRPYNFSNSVKKISGTVTRKLHDSTVSELAKIWALQDEKVGAKNYQPLTRRKGQTPEDFLLPTSAQAGSILYLLESKAETPAIFEMKDGKSRKILEIGAQENPWFSYASGKITWDEFRFDARYHQRSFNVINVFDLASRARRQLTHKSRLFAPSLSPDGKSIVAVEVSTSQQISLVEIDAENGKEIRRYLSPKNQMLQMPSFHPNGKKIVVVAVANSGKSIFELDRSSGEFKQLMPFQLQEILRPVYAEDQIVFKAHFNGIDNLYRLDPSSQKIFQLTTSKFGAHNPYFDQSSGTLLFNNHSPEGYDIASIKFTKNDGTDINSINRYPVNYADPLVRQEAGGSILENIPANKFQSKRYRELSHLFNFHSLVPVLEENPFLSDSNFGLQLQSDNKLNTLSFYSQYRFNNALRKSEYEAGFTYRKYFPIINFSYLNQARSLNRRTAIQGKPVIIPVSWREHEYAADISVPLFFNQFNSNYGLSFKVGTSFTDRYAIQNNFAGLLQTLSFPMRYEFSATRNSRRSARDLAPRWGQNITVRYRHFPFENRLQGDLFTFRSTLYFPGLFRNHSFQASVNFQSNSGSYQNTIDIPRVSGYSFLTNGTNTRNSLLLDYRFPLFYPDWELGPLAYIKRFKAGLFADYDNFDTRKQFSPRSYGAELRADMNLLRFALPNFDLGGRIIFLNGNSNQNPIFETVAVYNF